MAKTPDSDALHAFVAQLTDQAEGRLKTAAADAKNRQAELTKAKKDPGNRLRSEDIRAALDAESRLALDARTLASRTTSVKRSMSADLERLLAVALDRE